MEWGWVVLSLAKARKDYYLQKLGEVSPREDYYLKGGQAAGRWIGSGANEIGLEGRVSAQGLVRLFDGQHPATGEQLGRRPRKDGVAAWDLTFSADKSVSLLWALGDLEVKRHVLEAFDGATREALAYLESVASSTRGGRRVPVLDDCGEPVVGENGKPKTRVELWPIETTGFVAASFTEFTSRADDPQLHTHVVVGNRVEGEDGKWRTVDARLLYRQKMAAGAIHEAELRARLTERLGVAWQPVERGLAEIEGFTRDQIMTFSLRRSQIEAWRDQSGLDDTAANSARAALVTRPAKKELSLADLLVEWGERAVTVGLTPGAIEQMLDRSREPSRLDPGSLFSEMVSASGLTARVSTFGRPEAIRRIAASLPEGGTRHQIEALADAFLVHPQVVSLNREGRESVYTVAELLETEQRIITRAQEGVSARRWSISESEVSQALENRPELTNGQRELVYQFATSGAGVEVGVGPAGTGKSTALAVIRELAVESDTPILGTALAAKAAVGLETATAIPSSTVARLLKDASVRGLPEGVVVVVDEAAMVGTRQLAKLSDHVEEAAGRLIVIGDPHQLPELEAGGLFQALASRLPDVELTENIRQTQEWEKSALAELRDGSADKAVAVYREKGRVITTDCTQEAAELAVQGWHQDVRATGQISQVLLIAHRNTTVDQLNQQARRLIKKTGRLRGIPVSIRDQSFQVGERVVCHRNRKDVGVLNGDLGTLIGTDPERRTVTVRLDRNDETRTIPRWYLDDGHVTYGYAITGHKAQGATTRYAHTVAEPGVEREWVYVTMSRGQEANTLYHPNPDIIDGDSCTHLTHRTLAELDAFSHTLQHRKAQRAAIELLERSR